MDVPITGVVGVLGGKAPDVRRQVRDLEGPVPTRPDAVEVRADLFEDPSHALPALREIRGGIPTIFTVRLPEHGGFYRGKEADRVRLYREALEAGAVLLDAEWDSEAARELATEGAPIVASFHDFGCMLETRALSLLTERMEELGPKAIKVVPTASSPADGVDMLRWLDGAGPARPRRVGFAMGGPGVPSRVLALAWGGAWTYGALGEAVAPGLLPVADLKTCYRSTRIARATRIFGLAGATSATSPVVRALNRAFAAFEIDAVYLPFAIRSLEEMLPVIDALPVDGLTVAEPLEREALEFAEERDEGSRTAGGADMLIVRRKVSGTQLFARRMRSWDSGDPGSQGSSTGPAGPRGARSGHGVGGAPLSGGETGLAHLVYAYGQFCGLTGRDPDRVGFEAFRAAQDAP